MAHMNVEHFGVSAVKHLFRTRLAAYARRLAAISVLGVGALLAFPVAASLAGSPEPASAAQQKQTSPAPKLPKAKVPATSASVNAMPGVSQQTPAQLTTEDLTAFLDGLVPLQIQRDDIAGAVIAVVKDGKVIFAKGYGYSDLKNKKPVSPDTTLFRVGSISKLFTWTAVMQQVELGKIDLDADINQYLDFHINEPLGKITMRDLMTHTPGFEEAIKDLITLDSSKVPAIGDYLKSHQPKQIFAPGTIGAYSNYGATLAGYIVQRVSGEDFYSYIEHHILQPLNMTHATFRQPLPSNLAPFMSQGFQRASGGAKPFEIVTAAPAGSFSISAMDITHFILAHLQDGTYNGAQILKPQTVKEMHSRQYGPDPKVNGMCLGFYEESRNGHRIIGHGGDTVYFHSDLHLIQDTNVGFFVSYNSLGRGDVEPRGPLFKAFMDRYFPYTPPMPTTATAEADARAVSGTYMASRRPQTNIFYLFALLGEGSVASGKDGTLIIAGNNGVNGQPIEWHEGEPNVWYDASDPQNKIVFKTGSNGREEMDVEFPAELFQRVPWYQTKAWLQCLLVFSLGMFALTLILWPIGAFVRWHYGHKLDLTDAERRARRWARLVCILDLLFWALFLGTIIEGGSHLSVLSSKMDWWFRVIQIIGWLGIIGTILALLNFFRLLSVEGRWWWSRVHNVLVALAFLVSIWLIWFTNLLSFNLNY